MGAGVGFWCGLGLGVPGARGALGVAGAAGAAGAKRTNGAGRTAPGRPLSPLTVLSTLSVLSVLSVLAALRDSSGGAGVAPRLAVIPATVRMSPVTVIPAASARWTRRVGRAHAVYEPSTIMSPPSPTRPGTRPFEARGARPRQAFGPLVRSTGLVVIRRYPPRIVPDDLRRH